MIKLKIYFYVSTNKKCTVIYILAREKKNNLNFYNSIKGEQESVSIHRLNRKVEIYFYIQTKLKKLFVSELNEKIKKFLIERILCMRSV